MKAWQWGFTIVVGALLGAAWALAFDGFGWRQVPLGLLVLFVSVAFVLLVVMILIPEAYEIREMESATEAEDLYTMRERVALNDLREAIWDAVQVIPAPRVADYVLTVIHETEDDGA